LRGNLENIQDQISFRTDSPKTGRRWREGKRFRGKKKALITINWPFGPSQKERIQSRPEPRMGKNSEENVKDPGRH